MLDTHSGGTSLIITIIMIILEEHNGTERNCYPFRRDFDVPYSNNNKRKKEKNA